MIDAAFRRERRAKLEQALRDLYAAHTSKYIANLFGVSDGYARAIAARLRLPKKPSGPKFKVCELHRSCRWNARKRGINV